MPYWDAAKCGRYVEPFAGSAMLFFAIHPKKALLADTNKELIDMYCAVKKDWKQVHKILSKYPCNEQFYYRLREQDCARWGMAKRAARFIYLNRFCFNGLYRTNVAGKFNVPYAKGTKRSVPTRKELQHFAATIASVRFAHQDFRETLKCVRKGDFVYIDPPYALGNREIFKQYGPATFGIDDLRDLASRLRELNRKGVFFLVSYAYGREALEILKGWHLKVVYAKRTVAGDASRRKLAKELFASNVEI